MGTGGSTSMSSLSLTQYKITNIAPLPSSLKATAPTETSSLSLHDALPICRADQRSRRRDRRDGRFAADLQGGPAANRDRKSTRLNSSHRCTSYAVFCLKKKKVMVTREKLTPISSKPETLAMQRNKYQVSPT